MADCACHGCSNSMVAGKGVDVVDAFPAVATVSNPPSIVTPCVRIHFF